MRKDRDGKRFGAAVAKLFAGRQREPSDLELLAYFETLEEFDIDLVEATIKQIRKRPGWIGEGDVHAACFAARNASAPKVDLKAIEGYQRDPAWDDPRNQAEARDLISRLKGGPLPGLLESCSGLPEREG